MLFKALAILSKIRRSGWAVTVRSDDNTLTLTAEPMAGGRPEAVAAEKYDPDTLYMSASQLARQCGVDVKKQAW